MPPVISLTTILLACEQALVFGFRLYSPFPGTAAYYNIGSRLWIKLLKPLLCFMSWDFLNALFLPTTVLSTQFIPNSVIYPKSAQIASSSPSSLCLLLLHSHIRFQFVTSDTNFIAKNSTFGVCKIYHFYWKPLRIWNYNLYSLVQWALIFVHSCYNGTFIGIRGNAKLIFTWMID